MAGFRDDFYCRVGRDYHEHMESSFIYGYVRREREQNLRLRIKEELFCLADTPLSKGRYTRFLVRALLTDRNLVAGLDGIMSLRELVEKTSVGEDSMENMENGSIREKLIGLSESLDRHPVLDIDVDVLRAVTNEILVSFEFEGEKKNPYVQLTSLYMDLYHGVLDSSDYIKGLLDFFSMNSKYIPGKADMAVLQENALAVWGKDVFIGVRKSVDKLARLAQFAESDDVLFAGFSSDNETYRPPRKKEKSMEILDAYFKYAGGNPFGGHDESAIPGDYLTWNEYYDACDDLKDTLNANRNDRGHHDVFLPMWLDREIGGGVFLIGRNRFEESAGVRIDSNCELGVVYFLGVEEGRAFEFSAFQSSSYDRDAFPGMEEAVSWFQNYDYREDALEEYRNCNSDAPVGCPDVFLKFFGHTAAEEIHEDLVSDEDIAETLAEFDRGVQEDRKRAAFHSVMKKKHRSL